MNDKKISIIIATLAIVLAIGVAISVGSISGGLNGIANAIGEFGPNVGASGTRFPNGLSTTSTSPSAGEVRTSTLTVTGTSTIASSPDGVVLWGGVTTVATTSAVSAYVTNSGSPLMCDGDSLGIWFNSTAFSPSLVFSVGEASNITAFSDAGITASTTVATSTDTVTAGASAPFILESGNSIKLSLGDITNTNASSTYYGNWDIEFAIHCWTTGQ